MAEEEPICTCDHDVSHKDDILWVRPPRSEKKHSPQQPRPYCKKCGRLKYTGSASAKDLGFYVNMLTEIRQKVDSLYRRKRVKQRVTQTQVRLIVNDLKTDEDFLDAFSNQSYNQYEFFKASVKRHCNIEDYIIDDIYEKMGRGVYKRKRKQEPKQGPSA